MTADELPPGPRLPSAVQTLGWWARPTAYAERLRRRHGPRFTLRLLGQPPFVVLADPDDVKALFTAPADVLHPGEGARLLEPIVGTTSVILLDGARHMEQRRLLLPAFHGDRMQRLGRLVDAVAREAVDAWPAGEPVRLVSHLQAVTLEIILRAVFGLEEGERLDALRPRLTAMLTFADDPLSTLPGLRGLPLLRRRFAAFQRDRAEADRLLFGLIAERRGSDEDRDDVLAMLLAARHADGSAMTDDEVRDELLTALVAGHETTASALAFAVEELARAPTVQQRAREDPAYLDAVITEVLRRRPVLPEPEPRLVKEPVEIGGRTYPAGVVLLASAYLIHHDARLHPDPYAFRPERWLDAKPGTYTWIPFGGGRRRCLGAGFATLEMRLVLRAALERFDLVPAGPPPRVRRRMITLTPGGGAAVVLRERARARPQPVAAAVGA